MPIGLGLAASHAPNVFIPPEHWDVRYKQAIGDVPQPLRAAEETLEVRKEYAARIDAAWETLRAKLEAYRPDALIMVTDDHSEMFDEMLCNPQIAMFLGETCAGELAVTLGGETREGLAAPRQISFACHQELARYIADGLVKRDFDITVSRQKETRSIGPRDRGMGHGFTRTAPKIMPNLDVPSVLFWLNCYYRPLPTAKRCLDLGKVVAEIVAERDERIAIFGTGGLSHDPRGPRAGWIDEPLDRAVLKALADGDPYRLTTLFELDSDTYHGGTGEIRNWLTVGGAMGATKATIVDYLPVHHIITGVGFAYWQA